MVDVLFLGGAMNPQWTEGTVCTALCSLGTGEIDWKEGCRWHLMGRSIEFDKTLKVQYKLILYKTVSNIRCQ